MGSKADMAAEIFDKGFNCAQVVFSSHSAEYGVDEIIKNMLGNDLNNILLDILHKNYNDTLQKINERILEYGIGEVLENGKSGIEYLKEYCGKRI